MGCSDIAPDDISEIKVGCRHNKMNTSKECHCRLLPKPEEKTLRTSLQAYGGMEDISSSGRTLIYDTVFWPRLESIEGREKGGILLVMSGVA